MSLNICSTVTDPVSVVYLSPEPDAALQVLRPEELCTETCCWILQRNHKGREQIVLMLQVK